MTAERKAEPGRVRLAGVIKCASGEDVKIIKQHMAEHVHMTLQEEGCISFEIFHQAAPHLFHVEALFESDAALLNHLRRTRSSPWWEATKSIPREYQVSGLKAENAG